MDYVDVTVKVPAMLVDEATKTINDWLEIRVRSLKQLEILQKYNDEVEVAVEECKAQNITAPVMEPVSEEVNDTTTDATIE